MQHRQRHAGFTLMEMVISLVVLGLLSVVMLPLLSLPVSSYLDAQRRVELQNQLDLIRGRLQDDLQYALPGSLRWVTNGAVQYLEYLEVKGYGRYRTDGPTGPGYCGPQAGCNRGDGLGENCAAETCFTTMGPITYFNPPPANPVPNVDYVAIMGQGVNPYAVPIGPLARITAQATTANYVGMRFAPHRFSLAAFPAMPAVSRRAYIVSQPVTYVCDPGAGTLTKFWGYNVTQGQPTAFAGAIPRALVANTINNCQFRVNQPVGSLRQVASLNVRLSRTSAGQLDFLDGFIQIGVREP